MRKITSKKKEEKKQKRNQLIGGLVLISILFVSLVGYGFGGRSVNQEEISYKGQEFVEQNGFWITKIGDFEFSLRYKPNELDEIDTDLHFLDDYLGEPLYISSDDIESESEIYRNLIGQNSIALRMQLACLDGEVCENKELPVKTCDDNFIVIRESSQPKVIQNNNCVFIRGEMENLTRITDGFLLKIIGL